MIRKEHVTALRTFRNALLEQAVSDLIDRHQWMGGAIVSNPTQITKLVDTRNEALRVCSNLNAEQFTQALMAANFLE